MVKLSLLYLKRIYIVQINSRLQHHFYRFGCLTDNRQALQLYSYAQPSEIVKVLAIENTEGRSQFSSTFPSTSVTDTLLRPNTCLLSLSEGINKRFYKFSDSSSNVACMNNFIK